MKTKLLTVAALALSACASTTSTTPPPAAPPPVAQPAPEKKKADDGIIRIAAGGLPHSTPHMWGMRYFELRRSTRGVELRLHEESEFQGSGMQPHQMPPTRHACTRWELMPPDVMVTPPAGARSCSDAADACKTIEAYLRSTAPAREAVGMPDTMFGRGHAAC
jgi:hypothetical protein